MLPVVSYPGGRPSRAVDGVPAGECRLPLGPAPAGTHEAARAVLAELGYDL